MIGDDDDILQPLTGGAHKPTFNTIAGGTFRNVVQSHSIDSVTMGDSVEAVRTSRFLDCYSATKAFLGDLYDSRRAFGFMRGMPFEQAQLVLAPHYEEAQRRLTAKENEFGIALYALEPLCDGPTRRVLGEVYSTVESMSHATTYTMLETIWGGMPPGTPAELAALLWADYSKYPDLDTHWTSMRALLKRLRVLLALDQWPSGVPNAPVHQ